MTNLEKKNLDSKTTVAYWSQLGGVEVKEVENGIEDYILCISGTFAGKKRYHRLKVYYGNRPHVILLGTRLYLDECLRT